MRSTFRSPLVISILLAALVVAVYLPTGGHQFVNLDDQAYVTGNSHLVGGLTRANMLWAFSSVYVSNWHPLTWLSHMADVQLYGMDPRGHHLTNVAIHAISSLLLLLFLARYSGSLRRSSFVAALFALHPLHVESVAWVAERKDLLCGLFWFLTLLVYAEFTASGKRRFYLLALSFFILGVLSKPMIVSLPVIMLLLDFWPLKRVGRDNADRTPDPARIRSVIQEKIPFFTISLLSCVVTVYAQMKGGAVANLAELPFLVRFQNAMVSYLRYIGKTFWPHDLAVFYPYPAAVPAWQFYGSLGLLLLVSGAVWVGRRHRYLVTGWLWFLITLLPVIGLVQVGNQAMADRYAYLPIIGLFIMVAWGIPDILHGGRWAKRMAATSAVIIVVVSSAATWRQIGYWRDSITLFRHTLQVTHNNAFIHYNLGLTLHRNGDIDEAIIEYGKTLAITPDDKDARNALGLALYGKGRLNEAQREYARALQLAPNDASTHNNLGVLYGTLGNLDAAIREFRAALLLDSSSVDAADNLTRAIVAKRARDN